LKFVDEDVMEVINQKDYYDLKDKNLFNYQKYSNPSNVSVDKELDIEMMNEADIEEAKAQNGKNQ
jgi:hypothetical protein